MIVFSLPLRYILTFSLLIALPTLWYFLIYCPLEQNIKYYQTHTGVLHKQKQSLAQLEKQVEQLEKKKSMVHKQYKLSCMQSQEPHRKGGILPFVNKAKESGIIPESCTSNKQQCSESSTKQPLRLVFNGSLEDVQKFLDSLTTIGFCSCAQLQLQKRKDTEFHVTCSFLSCCFL